MLAVIGGSGFTKLPQLSITDRRIVRTPYGLTSSPLLFGKLGSQDIVFLARHGFGHTIAPHEINYRANIWALHSIGAKDIISVASVISINEALESGSLVIPHDLIDYTHGRGATFFEGQEQPVAHTDFTSPYTQSLQAKMIAHAQAHDTPVYRKAVYGCLQGPRWPTRAEINRYRQDRVDVLGMTGMPEAILARELDMNYAHFCGIIGMSCIGEGASQDGCVIESHQSIEKIRRLLVDL